MGKTYSQEVKNGMTFLDSARPGWDRRVDLTRLDLKDERFCVVGQLDGLYDRSDLVDHITSSDVGRGFTLQQMMWFPTEWAALTAEWRTQIGRRRALQLQQDKGASAPATRPSKRPSQ